MGKPEFNYQACTAAYERGGMGAVYDLASVCGVPLDTCLCVPCEGGTPSVDDGSGTLVCAVCGTPPEPPIAAGTVCIFRYPKHFVTLPDYSAHRGQHVTILRELRHRATEEGQAEYDFLGDRMYKVRAEDGWTGHAWESELEVVRKGEDGPDPRLNELRLLRATTPKKEEGE